mmetsp:Transcript_61414/g.164956  ORF Transcript_61414/g.164956 Transcript_61414/m.164956 type:complete len:149 (+) Transcript_61414:21-467(+)
MPRSEDVDLESQSGKAHSDRFDSSVPNQSHRDVQDAINPDDRDVRQDQVENVDEDEEEEEDDGDDDEYLIQKFTEAFNQVDVDKEGEIFSDQLSSVMAALGQVVGEEELEEMIADMTDDTDGADTIKLDDYLDVMIARHKVKSITSVF